MRKPLLCLVFSVLCLYLNQLHAQYGENFQTTPVRSVPAGWTVSSNTDVAEYGTPYNDCAVGNKGLQTPGVGPTAPVKLILPIQTFNSGQPNITIDFSIFVFDATLKCNSMKAFPCVTYVKAYLVKSSVNYINSDVLPTDVYAEQPRYQIVNANTTNTIVFSNVTSIPNGTTYRLLLDFKTVDNGCQSGQTKFIFDDFGITSSNCPNGICIPDANDDFFSADEQGFNQTVSGNLFGGFALWATQVGDQYKMQSLDMSPAVNGGLDKDDNNPSLNTMTFSLISGPKIEATYDCPSPMPAVGVLALNPNGTFTYTNSNPCIYKVSFTYQVNNGKNLSRIAKVTILLPQPKGAPLPVILKSFNAKRNKDKVDLTWETVMELNNRGFDVQRKTGNSEWKSIAFVFSQAEGGNSNRTLTYEFSDISPAKGTSQYRLRQVDIDTRVTYSEVRSVHGEVQTGKLLIYPNPSVDGNINLVFEENNVLRNISITDMTGRVVKQYRNIAVSSLQITNLQNGIYTLHISKVGTGEIAIEKVIIKKR